MSVRPSVGPAELRAYQEQGYIILRGAFSKQRIASLVDGVNRIIDAALAGKCEIAWIDREKRLPNRISNMLAPDKYQEAFGRWLDEDLHPQIEKLLGAPPRHSLFGMLAGGGGKKYLQAWHRDLGKPGAPDEVAYMTRFHGKFVQFNAPIQPRDRFLNIVPASHNRASTPAEVAASKAGEGLGEREAVEKLPVEGGPMPGAITVELEPGDITFYDANLWHRGWNTAGDRRWTMHSAFWRSDLQVMAHEHGQRDALLTPGHLDRLPPTTRQYIQRYLDAYPEGKPKAMTEL
jgi:hypothetical protein